MDIYVVQNLTNRKLKFQDKFIEPYASAEYIGIADFITLSRLFNAGMVQYSTKTVKPSEQKVEVPVEPTKEEPVVEKIVEAVEKEEVVEDKEPVKVVEEEVKESKPYTNKKNKRNSNTEK